MLRSDKHNKVNVNLTRQWSQNSSIRLKWFLNIIWKIWDSVYLWMAPYILTRWRVGLPESKGTVRPGRDGFGEIGRRWFCRVQASRRRLVREYSNWARLGREGALWGLLLVGIAPWWGCLWCVHVTSDSGWWMRREHVTCHSRKCNRTFLKQDSRLWCKLKINWKCFKIFLHSRRIAFVRNHSSMTSCSSTLCLMP